MQLDSHGNIVHQKTAPDGFVLNKKTGLFNKFTASPKTRPFKLTKTQRKELKKETKAYYPEGHKHEGKLKPSRKSDGTKGYNFIMAVLSRGCSVRAA